MTVLEYVARFTELARFGDDYVATDAAKVRRFEDGLKLSIRSKIVGHNLQDMDSMVSTTLIIEQEEGESVFLEFGKEVEGFQFTRVSKPRPPGLRTS